MARLTMHERDLRRERILNAARTCVGRHGLEAVSMEMIIAESGLSTGGVYRLFRGKDEIIAAAVTSGTAAAVGAVLPVLDRRPPPPVPVLIGQVLAALPIRPAVSGRDPHEPGRASIHGWSHAQSDEHLGAEVRSAYLQVRRRFADLGRVWAAAGDLAVGIDPDAVAELLTSVTLGFVAQLALVDDADPGRHEQALAALVAARNG
ncbi:MAG: TetR/AcrR family transcriptional regulator [Nakamurella multipartita]